jgi:hypothetical protein
LARTGKMHRLSILRRECIVVIQHNCAQPPDTNTKKRKVSRTVQFLNLSLLWWQKMTENLIL